MVTKNAPILDSPIISTKNYYVKIVGNDYPVMLNESQSTIHKGVL
jgi:hypothetical protein